MKISLEKANALCPCCEKVKVEPYDICPVCGWQNDTVQRKYPNVRGGAANLMSLNEAREAYRQGKEVE